MTVYKSRSPLTIKNENAKREKDRNDRRRSSRSFASYVVVSVSWTT